MCQFGLSFLAGLSFFSRAQNRHIENSSRETRVDAGTAETSSLASTFKFSNLRNIVSSFQAFKLSSDDYGRDKCCHGLHPCCCTFSRLWGSNQRRIFMQMLESTFFRLRSPWTHVLASWFSTAATTIGFFNCSRAQEV